ncbi:hypothetical protein [Methanosarcina sp.]|uniref:hypothetical protein n=1 Tax=Methanosarcina sp. TaxID=2213 RepID=UPI003C777962
MGKQLFDRTKILGISILVLLVMSMTVAVVSAQPTGGGAAPGSERGYSPGGGGQGRDGNCKWVCNKWDRQRYCDDWSRQRQCDRGHWSSSQGRRYWVCDKWSWKWKCDHWSWRRVCKDWDWRCSGRR